MERELQHEQIASSARSFITAAFARLAGEGLIPTLKRRPYLSVGRDYDGPRVSSLPEFVALRQDLETNWPDAFDDPNSKLDPEFADDYIFSFLETCVSRCSRDGVFENSSAAVDESIEDLYRSLVAGAHSLTAVRAVSHLTTADGNPVALNGITIAPELPGSDRYAPIRQCCDRVPRALAAFNCEYPFVSACPHALLETGGASKGIHSTADTELRLSAKLERFMLLLRLLTGTTAKTHFEVRGPTTPVAPARPELARMTSSWMMPLIRRTAVVDIEYERPLRELDALLDLSLATTEQYVTTAFQIAVERFNRSFNDESLTALVDLATALEAVFIDESDGRGDISLRLKVRSATLLSTSSDPASRIFEDISAFYDLRSVLVHGSDLKQGKLKGKLLGISTVTQKSAFGIGAAQAVDRMRDLVRRAMLARIGLSTGDSPMWPFGKKVSADSAFADDRFRQSMRERWREVMASIGAPWAVDSLGAPGDILEEDFGSARA